MDEKHSKEKWEKVTRGNKITKEVAPYYVHLSKAYANIAKFSADPGPPPEDNTQKTETKTTTETSANKHQSNFKLKAARRLQYKISTYMSKMNDDGIIDLYIIKAEDERTAIAKQDFKNTRRITIDAAHAANHQTKSKPALLQQGKNVGYSLATTVHRMVRKVTRNNQQVRFSHKPTVACFQKKEESIMITYYSGADNHYMSEADRIRLGLPILRPSHKRVEVANGGTSSGKCVTRLPFPQLSTATRLRITLHH